MKDKVCFKSDTSAQIIILTGFVIAIIVVGMGTVLYSAANSGQQTSILQSDRAYNNFENIREEYGIALMVSSENGEIDPFNVSNTTIILEFEDRMKTIVESHGFILNFTDHMHIQGKNHAVVHILFADGKKVFNDSVMYNLLTGEIIFDSIPPGYIYDLHAKTPAGCTGGNGVVELNWTAVGNDKYEDNSAYKYEIRYSNKSIDSSAEFDSATLYGYYYNVEINGTPQIYFVEELDPVLWHFAIKVYDEAGNYNFSNSANTTASEWSPEIYNITVNNDTSNFIVGDPYQPSMFAEIFDDITIEFRVRDRDNDNVNVSLMVRNKTFKPNGWDYGDWYEGHNWPMGNYSDMILSYNNLTDITKSYDYYFNVTDDSFCGKNRACPTGAPDDYYWIELPHKNFTTVAIDWRFVNDTYIDENDPDENHGTDVKILVKGDIFYSIIKFNLSSIPENATIESANIIFWSFDTAATQNGEFYRILQDWNEDNVTFNNWYSTSNYSSEPNITGVIYQNSYHSWSAFSEVEYFHNHRNENYGWLIKVTGMNKLSELGSKEAVDASKRPVLYVTYSQ
ncbi:MAG: hypothetical protein C5S44_10660 [Candidatus Methanocomedens sp.]|nr:MAG: hypothetical protein C5S44_10660 [ANME-2 cluster archaeon]